MKKRKKNKKMIIFTIINLFFTILLSYFIFTLNILPLKYSILLVGLLLIIDIGAVFLIKQKKKGIRIIGYIISIILALISTVGSYYLSTTNSFLNKAFDNAVKTYTNTYYVVALKNSTLEKIDDLKDQKIGYYESIPNIEEALTEFNKKTTTENKKYESIIELLKDLKSKKISATIIEENIYEALLEDGTTLNKNDYKIIDKFDLEIEEEQEEIVDDGNSFSVYIGGVDFTEKNTDFNMVVTINKKTHKILLTSLPRDYYVTISGKGMKELLGYVGYFGINTSRKTVEDLFGINIDYYVKINTESIVGLVDTLNGVQFCSDSSYTTTHALVMGSYDDTTGKKLTVSKGCRTYSGIEILTIARERKAFVDGDRQRQRNCQDIMISIFKKMANADNITNYSNILNAVSNLYTTNISKDLITELARNTIDGASWTFEQQSVTGRDSSAYVHLGTVKDYVMIPNTDSIATAQSNMKKIISGK